MLIRQSLNFTAHLAAGAAFGALLYVALKAVKDRSAQARRYPTVEPDAVQETNASD